MLFTFLSVKRWIRNRRRRHDQIEAYWRINQFELEAHNRQCKRTLLYPTIDSAYYFAQSSEHPWLDGKWPHSYTSHRYRLVRLLPVGDPVELW